MSAGHDLATSSQAVARRPQPAEPAARGPLNAVNPSKNSTPPPEPAKERAKRRVAAGVYKRLLVFCDGTGQQTDAPVARPEKKKTWTDTFKGTTSPDSGAFGVGLNENVCEAYIWLCLNWILGDEIVIFGFSRGAFTARAISGLVNHLGIIDRSILGSFHSIYDAHMRRAEEGYESTWANMTDIFPGANSGRGGGDVKIRVVGFGTPSITWAFPKMKGFALSPTPLAGIVSTPSTTRPLATTNLRQCWFPGSHSDVGGSYEDAQPYDSSDLSLLWMIRQCRPHLVLDETRLRKMFSSRDAEWWGAQPLHDSFTFAFLLNGHVRLRLLRAQNKEEGCMRVEGKTEPSDKYDSAVMAGFKLEPVNHKDPKQGYNEVQLMEDRLGKEERAMLPDKLLKLLDDAAKSRKLEFLMAGGGMATLDAVEKGTKAPVMVKRAWEYIGFG
ncbi:hypothetical protein C8R44DRAFT_889413 [Mycena epipterygia]|nr:hypothetical protein C8R44DRAFT_889413 [Mycena epipterygia]